ncbi:hypothetical protein BX600DRAFT_475774 [Xylariales sp. PMI_506]|nr:hypothetical protein BX600DRAFT_475774 [Xylariales sp. PMI_506]
MCDSITFLLWRIMDLYPTAARVRSAPWPSHPCLTCSQNAPSNFLSRSLPLFF